MEQYITKNGKQMRLGYTTGSCAAAASKAAAFMLLAQKGIETVRIITPNGTALELEVLERDIGKDHARCAIRKDGGDDPDVTNGALIFSEVSFDDRDALRTDGSGELQADTPEDARTDAQAPGHCRITIDGGKGVGRVTKPGLDQPVGSAAINSVPRKMIREAVEQVCEMMDCTRGLHVEISVPRGEEIAKKTFNSSLGIIGGISIIGTTGIVEPMSEAALTETTKVTLSQRKAEDNRIALLTPGNYGEDYIKETMGEVLPKAVQTSNFIGEAIDSCIELGFEGFLLVGHIGKLVKIAGGMLNTHSRYGDCRMDIMAATAGACGLDTARIDQILDCATVDEALRIIDEAGLKETVLARLTERIMAILEKRAGEDLRCGVILFSRVYGFLAESENAQELLREIRG